MKTVHSLTFLLVISSHLTNPTVAAGRNNPQQQLDQAWATWSFFRNDGYYDFQYSESGLDAGTEGFPWSVEVREGKVNRTVTVDGNPLPTDSPEVPTINTVFSFIQDAIDNQADTIRVTYNETRGYPSLVFLDNDADGRGDEYLVQITNVQPQPTYDVATEQAKLDQARSLWEAAALSAYTFQYNRYCFGCWFSNYPYAVQILEGRDARALDSTGTAVQDGYSVQDVNDVFDTIQSSLDAKAFEVHFTYSAILGYPKRFFYNADPNIIDEEFSIEISKMAAIGNPLGELMLAREQWEANSIFGYSYRLNKPNTDSELAYPWTVEVFSNGFPVSITDANGNLPVDDTALLRMEDHLDTVESALQLGTTQVEVTYSKPWGFPRTIHIDPGTGGDVEHLEISKFRPYRSMAKE